MLGWSHEDLCAMVIAEGTSGAETAAAVAAVASAVAALLSLLGFREIVTQSKKAAHAAEETLNQQVQPVLSPRMISGGAWGQRRIEVSNVGRGVALRVMFFPVAREEAQRWEEEVNSFSQPSNYEKVVLVDHGHPLTPGRTVTCDVDADVFGIGSNLVLAYSDERGSSYQCRAASYQDASGPNAVLFIVGYLRWTKAKIAEKKKVQFSKMVWRGGTTAWRRR